MNEKQIAMVQESFEMVRPIAPVAAELFYANLFELDPSLRRLFKKDITEQGKMLMAMISSAVRGLSNAGALVPVLTELGRRHTTYGVLDSHYLVVGTALIRTLEKGLGEAFTPEVRDAWCAAYELMSGVMRKGAQEFGLRQAA